MGKKLETTRAKVGATLLDVLRPGWAAEINAAILDLSDCTACVLGQLFGKYGAGAEKLFAIAATAPFREGSGWMDNGIETAAARCGFVGEGNKGTAKRALEYTKLTAAWRNEIAKRLPTAQVAADKSRIFCDACGNDRCLTPVTSDGRSKGINTPA